MDPSGGRMEGIIMRGDEGYKKRRQGSIEFDFNVGSTPLWVLLTRRKMDSIMK